MFQLGSLDKNRKRLRYYTTCIRLIIMKQMCFVQTANIININVLDFKPYSIQFKPYSIQFKSITQVMTWLFVSVGSRLLKAVTNYDDKRLQITRGERELGVKLNSIVTQSSQNSTITVRVDRWDNWETTVRLNQLILWRQLNFGTGTYASTHKKFDIDTST